MRSSHHLPGTCAISSSSLARSNGHSWSVMSSHIQSRGLTIGSAVVETETWGRETTSQGGTQDAAFDIFRTGFLLVGKLSPDPQEFVSDATPTRYRLPHAESAEQENKRRRENNCGKKPLPFPIPSRAAAVAGERANRAVPPVFSRARPAGRPAPRFPAAPSRPWP